jgi:arsenate reductase (glutaredoxin)
MNITIYHHPGCSKSRKTLEILRQHGIEPRVVEYLKTVPDEATILKLANLLGVGVADILRKGEAEYDADMIPQGDRALAQWLTEHPRVLERPIVVDEERNRAVIGRPPETVLELLSGS